MKKTLLSQQPLRRRQEDSKQNVAQKQATRDNRSYSQATSDEEDTKLKNQTTGQQQTKTDPILQAILDKLNKMDDRLTKLDKRLTKLEFSA